MLTLEIYDEDYYGRGQGKWRLASSGSLGSNPAINAHTQREFERRADSFADAGYRVRLNGVEVAEPVRRAA